MAHINGGFEKHGLDDDAFGPKGGLSNLKTFDAFRKLPLLNSCQEEYCDRYSTSVCTSVVALK
jgi:hypothetical protein